MASRKVFVRMQVHVIMTVDEGQDISDVVNEFDYDFSDTTGHAFVEDFNIEDFEVTDSK